MSDIKICDRCKERIRGDYAYVTVQKIDAGKDEPWPLSFDYCERCVQEIETFINAPVGTLSIEDLDLSVRSYNCLCRGGIKSVSELISKTRSELLQLRNFGEMQADEVEEKLKAKGLRLRREDWTEAEVYDETTND